MCARIPAPEKPRERKDMLALSFSFFVTAILYASVGFGGGSTYNALLVLGDVDYRILPSIALFCNLIVVSGGVWKFARVGYVDLRRMAPWVITSVPAAWVGGSLHISEKLFVGLLGFSLLVAAVRMLWSKKKKQQPAKAIINQYRFLPPVIGVVLGLLAGLVGIGGGIFLAPILYFMRWDSEKKIAATCSVFILVNSVSGLIGQVMKLNDMEQVGEISVYWLLFPAVLVGGQIGSTMGAKYLNPKALSLMTALLILYVSLRLLLRWASM